MYKPKLKELLPLIDKNETIELYYKGGYVGEFLLLDQINDIPEWLLNTKVESVDARLNPMEIYLRDYKEGNDE